MKVQCCIVGGGPAGMVAGFLLARAGIEVTVLEKHGDFLRDFRGDTIHPSTLEIIKELGLIDSFLKLPHSIARQVTGVIGGTEVTIADFTHLKVSCPYVAFMPQWDFLNFLAKHAAAFPNFHLMMNTEAIDLLREKNRVTGVVAKTSQGELKIQADLVLGTDGRHSLVRKKAGLKVLNLGAPMDVLWMRLSRKDSDPRQPFGIINLGKIFVMLDRGDYWQCAYVIAKGQADAIRARGLAAFQKDIVEVAPRMHDRVDELKSWDDVKLLTVAVDRLKNWSDEGVLCIGDAAHAMSPIGGVGINLAIQDAVASANILAPIFKVRTPTLADLGQVQQRRMLPTRLTQAMQLFIQKRVITRVLQSQTITKVPFAVRLLGKYPFLRRIPARIMGIGFRPEHVA